MRYRLRTLLILLAMAPPALWAAYKIGKPAILHEMRQRTRPRVPGAIDSGGEIYYFQPDDSK